MPLVTSSSCWYEVPHCITYTATNTATAYITYANSTVTGTCAQDWIYTDQVGIRQIPVPATQIDPAWLANQRPDHQADHQADHQLRLNAELADRIERQIARTEASATAHDRAEALLRVVLNQRQREQFECDRSFEVITSRGGRTRRYRLTSVLAGNVFLLNEYGHAIERFCIHVDERIPIPDNLVTQKFMLETDEDRFLGTANRALPGPGNTWRPAA